MTLKAKTIVKNKCWIVEDNGEKVGSVLSGPEGVTLVKHNTRETFNSWRDFVNEYNVKVQKENSKEPVQCQTVYSYPCKQDPFNVLWNVQHSLPVFTKTNKSKSFFCAGYYIIKFTNNWARSYCPKLISLSRYPYQGPFHTQEEMQEHLREANKKNKNV
jgi:hypothetical protein